MQRVDGQRVTAGRRRRGRLELRLVDAYSFLKRAPLSAFGTE